MRPEPFSLYVHIPYCTRKCPYCDFNVHVVARIPEIEYTDALLQELTTYAQLDGWRGRALSSVFFGGGTPSVFSPGTIAAMLEKIASLFSFAEEIEITLEANPEDRRHFLGYRCCGVNRLSIGAQSFQPRLLKFLGRVHAADETREALKIALAGGFDNVNLDLIYAIPGQALAELQADLDEALNFKLPHLSAYNLTIEEATPFHRDYRRGKLTPVPEEAEIAMAELIQGTLAGAGLERYEISNYARAGFQSRHNLNYWQGGDYLGIGAGAHSYLGKRANGAFGERWHNEKKPGRYMEEVKRSGQAVVEREESDLRKAAAEFMFMGLRMMRGISVDEFSLRFGKDPCEFYPRIRDWVEGGLMEQEDQRLRLTHRGLLVANSLFVEFV
jgi:oxygen-independent coproporphyrinogen-3 oxidase